MGVDDLPAARAQTQNTGATRELYLFLWESPLTLRWNRTIREVWGHEGGARRLEVRDGYLRVGAMGPQAGLVGEANQRRSRVQRDKKMVWERLGGWVWCWWAQQSRG